MRRTDPTSREFIIKGWPSGLDNLMKKFQPPNSVSKQLGYVSESPRCVDRQQTPRLWRKHEENRYKAVNLVATILLIWLKQNLLTGLRKTSEGKLLKE